MGAKKFVGLWLISLICLGLIKIWAQASLAQANSQLSGQSKAIQTGTISGRVFQPDLKPCPEAKIEVELGAENKIQAKTDEKGFYMIPAVPSGKNYIVTASKEGFKSVSSKKIKVSAGKNTTVNLVLKKLE